MKRLLACLLVAALPSVAMAAHIHLYADADGGQLTLTPSAGGFDANRRYTTAFDATGAPDPYLPGFAVSFPTFSTLENFDGERSASILNHDVGFKVTTIAALSGSPTTTFTWLITAQDREFLGQNPGNPADQTLSASLLADGLGGYVTTSSGLIDMGPLFNGIPTGNHWHGQHMAFSSPGVYDVTFQLVDLNATNGLAATYGVLADSPAYTLRFNVVPEPASIAAIAPAALLLRRKRAAR
jgi:hypothetical protein